MKSLTNIEFPFANLNLWALVLEFQGPLTLHIYTTQWTIERFKAPSIERNWVESIHKLANVTFLSFGELKPTKKSYNGSGFIKSDQCTRPCSIDRLEMITHKWIIQNLHHAILRGCGWSSGIYGWVLVIWTSVAFCCLINTTRTKFFFSQKKERKTSGGIFKDLGPSIAVVCFVNLYISN